MTFFWIRIAAPLAETRNEFGEHGNDRTMGA